MGFDPTLLSRIEDAGINASAPPRQRWVDGWLVRFSPGKAKRARCINPVATGRMTIEKKLEICQSLYDSVGLGLMVRVTPFSQPEGIDAELARFGFEAHEETCVMVSSGRVDRPPATPPRGYRIEPLSHRALAETVGQFRGTPLAQREAHAERLEESPVPFSAFAVFDRNGVAAACGQYAIEGELVGLYDVFTRLRPGHLVWRLPCASTCWRRPRHTVERWPTFRSKVPTSPPGAFMSGLASAWPIPITTAFADRPLERRAVEVSVRSQSPYASSRPRWTFIV